MRCSSRPLWAVAAMMAVAVPQVVLAQDAKPADAKPADTQPVMLTTTSKAKDAYQYSTTITLNFNGTDVTLVQNIKHTVKEVKENGDITMVSTDLGGKMSIGGNDMDIPVGGPVTITMTKLRKLTSFKPEKEDNPYLSTSTQFLLAMISNIVFPDKAVKAGDSWDTELDNPQVKGKKVAIKTTFVGPAKVGDVQAWKVKQTLEADTEIAGAKLKAEYTALLDPTNGQVIEGDEKVTGVPGNMGSIDWTGKVKRVKPAEKAEAK